MWKEKLHSLQLKFLSQSGHLVDHQKFKNQTSPDFEEKNKKNN